MLIVDLLRGLTSSSPINILHRHQADGIKPENIVAFTFTDKAAAALIAFADRAGERDDAVVDLEPNVVGSNYRVPSQLASIRESVHVARPGVL
ncbi:MAG TPA: hypothetical protein VK821_21535 [Dehalococcoidia bacterium]|nr:hypothetical protein [Dehalococcoidia bacterium]